MVWKERERRESKTEREREKDEKRSKRRLVGRRERGLEEVSHQIVRHQR